MFEHYIPLAAGGLQAGLVIGGIVTALFALLLVVAGAYYGTLWIPAYMSGADVSLLSLIGMSFRQIQPGMIVTAKIMGTQAGLNINRTEGMSTARCLAKSAFCFWCCGIAADQRPGGRQGQANRQEDGGQGQELREQGVRVKLL